MNAAYEELLEGEFVQTLNAIVTHLHAQNNLIADMGQPKLTTQWVVMGVVSD